MASFSSVVDTVWSPSRSLDRLDLPGEGVHRLAELYREARFSRHDITEQHRSQAQSALDEVHAQIGQRRVGAT